MSEIPWAFKFTIMRKKKKATCGSFVRTPPRRLTSCISTSPSPRRSPNIRHRPAFPLIPHAPTCLRIISYPSSPSRTPPEPRPGTQRPTRGAHVRKCGEAAAHSACGGALQPNLHHRSPYGRTFTNYFVGKAGLKRGVRWGVCGG